VIVEPETKVVEPVNNPPAPPPPAALLPPPPPPATIRYSIVGLAKGVTLLLAALDALVPMLLVAVTVNV
jgi:hypothetical protein